ncbi:MAG TPA: NAD(P)(+) transhydrogenase (Re/Si-specific) subunit beta [Streptosporangiaceae bacterium]|nr:NAD(P)(+) transhydrogenase (Re/Si-specific) subunit beta [Streptosporangiaceae bacterium]
MSASGTLVRLNAADIVVRLSAFDTVVYLIYIAAAACFVLGLHLMNSPVTARRGNQLSAAGMIAAIAATFAQLIHHHATITATGWIVVLAGIVVGSAAGLYSARTVKMTAMPQLVSLFNAVGGGAAAIVAINDFVKLATAPGSPSVAGTVAVATALDVLIGAVTFTGSLIAAGKLQGVVSGAPISYPGSRVVNALLAVVMVGAAVWLMTGTGNIAVLVVLLLAACGFGVTMVLPIGGADMPVVISLLNAFTGTAVAMAGFVINNPVLITAGALVGASGSILTKLMADAMNRSIPAIIIGGFGTGDTAGGAAIGAGAGVRTVDADDAAIQLAYAQKVIIVPGYGLAAAQAQNEVQTLAELLEAKGVDVTYAIHPVAGRMPGHMNVLLAEANVPYSQLKEMDEINPDFPRADVALVIGANDVTNPAARRPGNLISGMPILDVDHAKAIIVVKRSMGHGYAGLDNELYYDPKTTMYFADAKRALTEMAAAVKTLVG